MPKIDLTPAQRKDHRSQAHHLSPVVMIGAEGLTPAVTQEVDQALKAHGLIKVRVFSDDRAARESMLDHLATTLDAAPIQHIGKLLVLWRPIPPKEKAEREDRKPGPRTVKLVTFSKTGNHRPTVHKLTLFGNQRLAAGGTVKRVKQRAASIKKKAAE